MVEISPGYRKQYNIRRAMPTKKTLEVTFPYEVVEKEARLRGLTVNEFIDRFIAVAEYNSFAGVRYTFELKANNERAKSHGSQAIYGGNEVVA